MIRGRTPEQHRFLQNLAHGIEEQKKPTVIVAAEDTEDVITAAKAYWMLGWSWDEIEGVLHDRGYSESTITKGMKKAKEYAHTQLNNGPFTLDAGQHVKLQDGTFETCMGYKGSHLVLSKSAAVHQNVIDDTATKKLQKAFELRKSAEQLLETIAQYEPPESEEEAIIPTYTYKPYKQAPPGTADETPEFGEVQEISDDLGVYINNLEGLRELTEEEKAEILTIKKQMAPINARIRDLKKDEQDEIKALFAALSEMDESLSDMETKFKDYGGKLVGLQKRVTKDVTKTTHQQDLAHVLKKLEETHPRISKEIVAELEQYRKTATKIAKQVDYYVTTYPYRKTPRRPKKEAQVMDWISGLWQKVKGIASNLYDTIFPQIDENMDAIDDFMAEADKTASQNMIESALWRRK